jgi:cation transporter-like permease
MLLLRFTKIINKLHLNKGFNLVILSIQYLTILLLITYLTQILVQTFNPNILIIASIRFLTSPFNSYFEGNYGSNIGIAFITLIFSEIYFKSTKRSRIIKIAFVSSIFASYIIAIDWTILHAVPTAGSSIVSGSILLTLAFFIFLDMLDRLKKILHNVEKRIEIKRWLFTDLAIYFFCGFIAYVLLSIYYNAYLSNNPDWIVHTFGTIGYVVAFVFFIKNNYFKSGY